MTSFARAERLALADTLLAAGPDAPTLCDGWATRDLAAHLVLRERRPDAAAGILITAVQRHTKQVQDRLAAGDYAALVGKVRRPALWVRPAFADEAVNITEFLVHHEDVRRAAPGWTPRARRRVRAGPRRPPQAVGAPVDPPLPGRDHGRAAARHTVHRRQGRRRAARTRETVGTAPVLHRTAGGSGRHRDRSGRPRGQAQGRPPRIVTRQPRWVLNLVPDKGLSIPLRFGFGSSR